MKIEESRLLLTLPPSSCE